jgi:hypothetical protein
MRPWSAGVLALRQPEDGPPMRLQGESLQTDSTDCHIRAAAEEVSPESNCPVWLGIDVGMAKPNLSDEAVSESRLPGIIISQNGAG